nr:hypothetical protein [uncultured Romboutsia sp.]
MSYVSLNSKTIKSILEDINVNKYLLSSIRREFIWSTVKIEKLFDSLMRDYLINSFLFWQVRGEGIQNYKFYEFLRNDISQEELEVLINMDKDIKKAEEKLEYLSSDPVTQELYFERERALHEKANLINTGIKQGIKQEKIEMARKLLQNNFSVQMIVELTELTEEEIIEIKLELH